MSTLSGVQFRPEEFGLFHALTLSRTHALTLAFAHLGGVVDVGLHQHVDTGLNNDCLRIGSQLTGATKMPLHSTDSYYFLLAPIPEA